jgi:putative hydrolase of the HAD superfamily
MSRPPAIVFDLGKVLVDFDWSIAGRRIAARSRRPLAGEDFISHHAGLIRRYELGQVSSQQLFEQLRDAIEFTGTRADFDQYFCDIFTPIQPMIDLHAALRRKGLPTYIFSNTNDLAVGFIRQRYPFFSHFNAYILSFEHGSMKPDAKLYEVVERETQCRGEQIVYIDDRPENIDAGAARGWLAVLHETPEKTRAALMKLKLP